MKKKIKTTTGNITLTMPDNLNEVTLGQLIAMQASANLNDLEAISILCNIPLNDLQNIVDVADLQIFSTQVLNIAQQIEQLYIVGDIPEKTIFAVDGKPVEVKVVKNLSMEPAGAFMASREIIADEIAQHMKQRGEEHWQENFNPSLTAYAQVLAQYFYCRATGEPYNEYAAAEFEQQVKQLPVTDAIPIARYFFLSYPNLSKPRTGYWQRLRRRWSSARG